MVSALVDVEELNPYERLKSEYASTTSFPPRPWRWTPQRVQVVCKVSFELLGPLLSQFVVFSEYFMYASEATTSGMACRVDARRR